MKKTICLILTLSLLFCLMPGALSLTQNTAYDYACDCVRAYLYDCENVRFLTENASVWNDGINNQLWAVYGDVSYWYGDVKYESQWSAYIHDISRTENAVLMLTLDCDIIEGDAWLTYDMGWRNEELLYCIESAYYAQVGNEYGVWVAGSGSGTRYHANAYCSAMSDPRWISLTEAEALGYTPCRRCWGY